MKKYRLKEEVKKYFGGAWHEGIFTLDEWKDCNFTLEALEEVPQRVELEIHPYETDDCWTSLKKARGYNWTDQEKDLCEKALNGELLDIDSLNNKEFERWYLNEYEDSIYDNIRKALKQYLNEKK